MEKTKKTETKKLAVHSTRRLTYIATLVAMTIMFKILGNILVLTSALRLTLTYTGWIIAAVFLGPFSGAVVGFCSDALGAIIFPSGAYIPLISVCNGLYPLIVGLVYKYLPLKNMQIRLIIGVVIATVFCTLGINSIVLYYYYYSSMTFSSFFFSKRIWQTLVVSVNLTICLFLIPVIKRLHLFDKY